MQKRKSRITEEKARRIAIGATVAGVLLILFLTVIMIVGFVGIGNRRSKLDEYNDLVKSYGELNESKEKELDWYMEGDGLYFLARRMGYK